MAHLWSSVTSTRPDWTLLQSILVLLPVVDHVDIDPVVIAMGFTNHPWSVYACHGLIVNQPLLFALYVVSEARGDHDCDPIV